MLPDLQTRLLRALTPQPPDLIAAISALAAAGAPAPSPWLVWPFLALLRHLPRQRRVGAIVRDRLPGGGGFLDDSASYSGHTERPRRGIVPGLPGFRYDFHGRGCRVTDEATDETIDVDFYEGSSDYFDPYFVIEYLASLRHPEPIEARVIALHPRLETLTLAFDSLLAAGLLVRHPRHHVFRLADAALASIAAASALTERWNDAVARPWIAAALGDWPLVAELVPGDESLRQRARRTVAERVADLEISLEAPARGAHALLALAAVSTADQLRCYLTTRLQAPPYLHADTALDLIDEHLEIDLRPELRALISRLSPEPDTHLIARAARLLLDRGEPPAEVMPVLRRCASAAEVPHSESNGCLADLAFIALEYAPEEALSLVRAALRASFPLAWGEAAAALMIFATPWAVRELESALESAFCEDQARDLQAALDGCRSGKITEAGHRMWQVEWIRARADRIKAKLPPDFGAA
jgi:hypothetical protein